MNTILKNTAGLFLLTVLLTSCSWDRRDTGTATGAVVGGLAGNLITGGGVVGTGLGALGGAVVGNQVTR